MSSRSCRSIALMLLILSLIALVCVGIIFVVAGDQIIENGRDMLRDLE